LTPLFWPAPGTDRELSATSGYQYCCCPRFPELHLGKVAPAMNWEPTADGLGYKVCLTKGAHTACAFVSSAHLIEDKRKQLEASIRADAQSAQQAELSA